MSVNKVFFSWEDFDTATNALAETIDSSYSPESVVSISRGGDPLGVQLSHFFDARYGSIRANHYDDKERKDGVEIIDEMLGEVEGNLLIVDDVSDTGKTLETVLNYLEGCEEIDKVKTATLHIKPETSFVPDFHFEETDKWVVYPWEYDS